MNALKKSIVKRKKQKQQTDMGIKLYTVGAKRQLLKILYILRFDDDFRFKKRLIKLLDKFAKYHDKINELSKDRVLATVLLKEIKDSGVDLGDIFDDLIEFEEVEYDFDKEQEYGRRCAGK